jgi:hypothetical protein
VTGVTITIVVVGVALAAAVGIVGGFDTTALIYFALIIALGTLAIAVARKSKTGEVGPRPCTDCGGLNSPNAPYCKHCGSGQ